MRCASLILILILAPVVALANPVQRENTRVELISEQHAAEPGTTSWLLVQFTPRDGWHTYWENPGDSGMAASLRWTLPPGFAAGAPRFQTPEAIPYGPLVNYGYEGSSELLVPLWVPEEAPRGETVQLSLDLEWLVCADICVPEQAVLEVPLTISAAAQPNVLAEALFAAARAKLPVPAPFDSLFSVAEGEVRLQLSSPEAAFDGVSAAHFYPLTEGAVEPAGVQKVEITANKLHLSAPSGFAPPSDALAGLVVLELGGVPQGFELAARPGAVLPPRDDAMSTAGLDFGLAMLFALLGGLILNLMPCVFPVLSLKALGLVKKAQADGRAARAGGVAYLAGVLVSFAAIGGAMLLLRAGGAQIGWGFQLQDPLFVSLLAGVMFVVGLNLSGLFELSGRFAGVGQGLTERSGLAGPFFTGVLACIVATPCTAPFMAPALGLTLSLPAVQAMLIFLMLGFGLALPYVLLAFLPGLARLLPRPGPWMESFRQFLAFPMFGTAIWLLWVLGQQAGMTAVAGVAGLMLVLAFVLWLLRQSPRPLALICGLALALTGGVGAGLMATQVQAPNLTEKQLLDGRIWTAKAVTQARQDGRPVLINFTAAWCITCKVNEQVAFADSRVAAAFQSANLAYFVGDWTRRDGAITGVLQSYGRSGVPLYLYYAPGAEVAQVLPQILTPDLLLQELGLQGV